jgi:phosphoribosyl-ATP pyrophosphohydrolase
MPKVTRRQVKLKREEVRQWLINYTVRKEKMPLKKYIEKMVKESGHSDLTVDMGEEAGEMTVAAMIMDDLESYARG